MAQTSAAAASIAAGSWSSDSLSRGRDARRAARNPCSRFRSDARVFAGTTAHPSTCSARASRSAVLNASANSSASFSSEGQVVISRGSKSGRIWRQAVIGLSGARVEVAGSRTIPWSIEGLSRLLRASGFPLGASFALCSWPRKPWPLASGLWQPPRRPEDPRSPPGGMPPKCAAPREVAPGPWPLPGVRSRRPPRVF